MFIQDNIKIYYTKEAVLFALNLQFGCHLILLTIIIILKFFHFGKTRKNYSKFNLLNGTIEMGTWTAVTWSQEPIKMKNICGENFIREKIKKRKIRWKNYPTFKCRTPFLPF